MEEKKNDYQPTAEEKEKLFQNILSNASRSGYFLNPDKDYTLFLMNGLLINEHRYGYQSCPCRLSTGIREKDLDLVCPCDYRDPDLSEFGMCYCGLYVSKDIFDNKRDIKSIPERRKKPAYSVKSDIKSTTASSIKTTNNNLTEYGAESDAIKELNQNYKLTGSPFANSQYPVWRCKVCGYLCARENPPEFCPICKASKERFERFS
jgi:ferredoxin-thioredoxin reductase catalytic subunit/rubredoxin